MINREQGTRRGIAALQVFYALSKRSTTYAQVGHLHNSANLNAGKERLGWMAGMRHIF